MSKVQLVGEMQPKFKFPFKVPFKKSILYIDIYPQYFLKTSLIVVG